MNTTHLTVISAQPGRSEQLGTCLQDLIALARGQTGCLRFAISQAVDDPLQWWMHGTWGSPAALQAYFNAPWLQQVLDRALRDGLIGSLACQSPADGQG